MNPTAWAHVAWCVAAAAGWLALYRLPLASPRRRQRARLAVSSATGIPPRLVFPIMGTVIYLVTAAAASALVIAMSGPSFSRIWTFSMGWSVIPVTALAVLGSAALTAFAMSVIYALRPGVDVAGAVSTVGWITEVMALPPRWRWVVPMSSAAFEEFFFRGVFCVGLLAADAPIWVAIGVSGFFFTVCQALLTENLLQTLVLVISSVVISVVGGLLVVATGSVLPAIVMHASFAGFYTNTGGSPQQRPRAASTAIPG